ncbi:hypothetical protein RQP46_007550 [Phenoliferia psychrophenolica]
MHGERPPRLLFEHHRRLLTSCFHDVWIQLGVYITWPCILVSYLRFYYGLKAQGIDRSEFAYRAPFQPYASIFDAHFPTVLVILFSGFKLFVKDHWDAILIFAIMFCGYKLYHKSKLVPLSDIDFQTGRRE